MSPKLLTANLLSVAIVISHCAFFASYPRAQEKANLANLSAQVKDKGAAVRQSAIEALCQLKDPAVIDLLISLRTVSISSPSRPTGFGWSIHRGEI